MQQEEIERQVMGLERVVKIAAGGVQIIVGMGGTRVVYEIVYTREQELRLLVRSGKAVVVGGCSGPESVGFGKRIRGNARVGCVPLGGSGGERKTARDTRLVVCGA